MTLLVGVRRITEDSTGKRLPATAMSDNARRVYPGNKSGYLRSQDGGGRKIFALYARQTAKWVGNQLKPL